ncbi:NUDIX hydrolase [Candidatus Saccharibacteria bacterium]|nr:NUDIX hydrolase [Candidatus Saccharibacteria bacterium]
MKLFPDEVSKKEQEALGVDLGTISDRDLWFETEKRPIKYRYAVRGLVFDKKGRIGVARSVKYDYYQVPGGGMEPGETIETALRREIREEIGYEISHIKPIGYFCEIKEGKLNSRPATRCVSYVFSAMAETEVGTNYTAEENAEDLVPTWEEVDFIIARKKKDLVRLAETEPENYGGAFVTLRDLKILEYYKEKYLDAKG